MLQQESGFCCKLLAMHNKNIKIKDPPFA